MTTDPHELAALYALDALDMAERERFGQHLSGCEQCREEVARLRPATTALANGATLPVPPGLRSRILSEIERTPQVAPPAGTDQVGPAQLDTARLGPVEHGPGQPGPGRDGRGRGGRRRSDRARSDRARAGRGRLLVVAAAAAVALIAAAGTLSLLRQDDPGGEVAAVLDADDARGLTLDSNVEGDGQGSIRVVWSAGRGQVAVVADGLDDPGPGRRYQLWRLEGDAVVPSELFEPDATGAARLVATLDGDPAGWGVTIEPETGSRQPTGDILYLGQV